MRYLTLTNLLGAAPDDPDVVAARAAIMTEGTVPRILATQLDDGHWEGRDRFYTGKYRGTVWQLVILAELVADGTDPRVRAACEAILRDSQDRESDAFSMARAKRDGGGLHSQVIPCLTGNMVWSLIRLGMRTTRACSARSTGSRPTSASTTATARRRPAGPTSPTRSAGAATRATWAWSRHSRRSPRSRRTGAAPRSSGPWRTARSSSCGTMSTGAAMT